MKIKEILTQIELFPQDKNFRIKDLVFKDLSQVINNYTDLIALIEIYTNEKNFRIKNFIFAHIEQYLQHSR